VIDPKSLIGKEGYFRVGKSSAGRWWLLRPDGRPILYRGVCALWMPDDGSGSEAAAFRKNWEKANGPDAAELVAHCQEILGELGFNAFGEWATPQFWNRGWPYTVLIHTREVYPAATVNPPKHIDVFDPAWQQAYDARCRDICTPLAHQKDLIGYFVDNESGWGQARKDFVWGGDHGPLIDKNVLGEEPLLLQCFLALEENRPGHKAAWDFVLHRHGNSVAQVAKDWGADFASPAQLREHHAKGLALASPGFGIDQDAFTTYFTQEYFRITSECIRRYDPNHLMLGCRHGGPPGDVVLKAYDRRHVDVLSFNNYRPNFHERIEEYYKVAPMPMLNTEFSWVGGSFLDWQKLIVGESFTPEERAQVRTLAVVALEGAFTHPALIGYTWYKFCTRFPSAADPAYGLLNPMGERNHFNEELLKRIHPRLEAIAMGQLLPDSSG